MSERPWLSLPCGCKASLLGSRWLIEAEAFLCDKGHKQGDLIPAERVADEMSEEA